jgi:hypothetical protein
MLAERVSSVSWSRQEFSGLDLGDIRLNERLIDVADALVSHPTSTLNAACGDWASAKAAYRLFDNDKVSPEGILAPHFQKTVQRVSEHSRVFAIQDTTYLDYTDHPSTEGLGSIGTKSQNRFGFVKHTTLMVNESGVPLGCLTDKVWVRDGFGGKDHKSKRLEAKESYRWIKALSEVKSAIPEGVEVIFLSDRESDIYEFFVEAGETPFVIRAAQDRRVDASVSKLSELVRRQEVAGEFRLEVARRGNQPAREAMLSVRFTEATLCPPRRRVPSSKTLPAVEMSVVWVRETDPPDGATPLEWLLLTNVKVSTFSDALQRIDWYKQRWQIEVYFKVLKSGTQVQQTRLATKDRLLRYIALLSVIAWRLYWLTMINRFTPDADCTHILHDPEWKALYYVTHKTEKLPEKIPTVSQAVIWIAKLGGFLARKSDGNPGVTVLWRGWQRLNDISNAFAIFQNFEEDSETRKSPS